MEKEDKASGNVFNYVLKNSIIMITVWECQVQHHLQLDMLHIARTSTFRPESSFVSVESADTHDFNDRMISAAIYSINPCNNIQDDTQNLQGGYKVIIEDLDSRLHVMENKMEKILLLFSTFLYILDCIEKHGLAIQNLSGVVPLVINYPKLNIRVDSD